VQVRADDELRLDERALIRMVRERDAAIREQERAGYERTMMTDLTEEDLKGLEGMCLRRQGRRMTVTLDLDVTLALVRDARALRRVEAECENIRAELGTKRTSSHAEAQVARCVARIEQALAANTEPAGDATTSKSCLHVEKEESR
jgi:hypothetical protein